MEYDTLTTGQRFRLCYRLNHALKRPSDFTGTVLEQVSPDKYRCQMITGQIMIIWRPFIFPIGVNQWQG